MSEPDGSTRLVVKICGLREPAHAVWAAEQGADLLGFVFAPSRRQVTAQTARRCIEAARAAVPAVRAVGVFVDASADELRSVADEAGLDLIQLHGSEPASAAASARGVVRAIRPRPEQSEDDVLGEVRRWTNGTPSPEYLLVDAYHPIAAGGTGEVADWVIAERVARAWPTLLAGGLTPANVASAIAAVRPAGVDVSSGVERDGAKAPDLIAAFIAAARATG